MNLMIVHGSMDGLIFLGHVKIGLKYVVIGLFHFLFWSIYTSSMYNFIYVNVHQKGIHPMLYQFGKINWFNLFCSKWVKSVAYKWIVHVFWTFFYKLLCSLQHHLFGLNMSPPWSKQTSFSWLHKEQCTFIFHKCN